MALHTGLDEIRTPETPHFSIGGIIGRSLLILVWNFTGFIEMAIGVAVPAALVVAIMIFVAPPGSVDVRLSLLQVRMVPHDALGVGLVVLLALLSIFAYLGTPVAIAYRSFHSLRGSSASIDRCWIRSYSVLPRLIGLGIILFLMLGLAVGAGAAIMTAMLDRGPGNIAIALVFIVIAIPALFLFVAWWVVIPVIAIERIGMFRTLARSWALTLGRRWQILVIVLLLLAAQAAVQYLVSLAIRSLAPTLPELPMIETIARLVVSFIFYLAGATVAAVGYYHLRGEKEGGEVVAKVFD